MVKQVASDIADIHKGDFGVTAHQQGNQTTSKGIAEDDQLPAGGTGGVFDSHECAGPGK